MKTRRSPFIPLVLVKVLVLSIMLAIIGIASEEAIAAELLTKSGYNAATIYPGSYTPNALYYRHTKGTLWLKQEESFQAGTYNCAPALNALSKSGKWYGALRANGVCGKGDETNWATGNRLNFEGK